MRIIENSGEREKVQGGDGSFHLSSSSRWIANFPDMRDGNCQMTFFTILLPPEANRRLLAFYNICAEYKKAIFQVFKPCIGQLSTSQRDNLLQGKKTKKELTALFSSYEVRNTKQKPKMASPMHKQGASTSRPQSLPRDRHRRSLSGTRTT